MNSTSPVWTLEPLYPDLAGNLVALWRIHLAACALPDSESLQRDLSDEELRRLQRLSHPTSTRNFAVCRTVMRKILAHYLNCASHDIEFHYNSYGKPYLSATLAEKNALYFNLAHSGEFALFALCQGAELGVDIEHKNKQRDFMRLAERFFHHEEYRNLRNLEASRRGEGFFRAWTRKEAFTKALGSGLQFSFKGFEVSLDEQAMLRWVDQNRYNGGVALFDVPVGSPYVASLAVLSENYHVHLVDWPNTRE